MRLDLERLSEGDLADLGVLYAHAAQCEHDYGLPASWRAHFADLAEAMRAEQARRRIADALERDPAGYLWYGRLAPPGRGPTV